MEHSTFVFVMHDLSTALLDGRGKELVALLEQHSPEAYSALVEAVRGYDLEKLNGALLAKRKGY